MRKFLLALVIATPLVAQDHTGHSMGSDDPLVQAWMAANAKMHEDMAIEYSGDADADFIRGMIPHHQGAIDMAKIVLEHGDDPEVKKLAEEVIKAQDAEIAWMQAWLKEHGH
jgi:uncharacterized protein (DUF305 family)